MATKLHLLFSLLLLPLSLLQAFSPDTQPLLSFKSSSDPLNTTLHSWSPSTDPCTSWPFVTCVQNRVTHLVLESLSLRGPLQPLTALTHLRLLSLKRNLFSGPLPDLSNLTSLKLLFLSHNNFSGDLPPSLPSLSKLYRLDLSHNSLSGQIPASLNRLTHLLTLRLEANRFSGAINDINLPSLQDFNVSGNSLVGQIPSSLSGFPKSSFGDNQALCGSPMEVCKPASEDPARPGSPGALASTVVSSSPATTAPITKGNPRHVGGSKKISRLAIISIIIGDVIVLTVVSFLLYCYVARRRGGKGASSSRILEGEKIVYSSSPYPATQQQSERGKMVFFEGARRFELEDLLRASAEMLGKGGFGTAYKAVLDDGDVVAVKRLKEGSGGGGGKREFEQQMEVLGRLRHPNVVGLKAYYFARDEKLLVFDYMPNGSLFWLLHGNRGPGRTPLDWTTRLRIAAGAARGLTFLHNSCKSLRLTHGNIKSTNILLDKAGNARVSDFGLSLFAPPTASVPRSNGYRAPEALDPRKISQKADVYSFGVLLLELLTGKCPSLGDNLGPGTGYGGVVDLPRWVQSVVREEWTAEVFDLELMRYKDIEEEMVGLLQVAMTCTLAAPDQRPKMNHVVKMIEEIRGVEVSPSHEGLDSDSPSISEDTCAVISGTVHGDRHIR
ncbi:hypothetical protein RHSIM_Rhsim09G0104900 [Rhododendron simsii]|uniref:Protein kinase domain-containing protein n=1 Tax=Rhododendron simsii TaxID=118357 RepID=A0A834GFJ1_RHOSS|nr:hypothetical protein RHSIM_Rhsim09G0104900 [Rhododendron simsii]